MEIIFTRHAKNQIKERKISKEEIMEAIKYPTRIIKKHDKYYYQKKLERGIVEIPCEKMEKAYKGNNSVFGYNGNNI